MNSNPFVQRTMQQGIGTTMIRSCPLNAERNARRQLEDEGVEKFNQPFDKLMETLAQRSPQHLTRAS
jgi:hypothetical protein